MPASTTLSQRFSLSVTNKKDPSGEKSIEVYQARPAGSPRGGVLIAQEIFGVTNHIQSVADRYAQLGFVGWAPAFFDAAEKGVVLPTNAEGMQKGMKLAGQIGWDWPLATVRKAAAEWAQKFPGLPLALVGYCWGGSLAWLSATRLGTKTALTATVGYYGSQAPTFKNETPEIPVMLHFGKLDAHITMDKVHELMDAQPQVPIELYDADHGFNRDGSSSYNAVAAALALDKTLAFLARNGF